MEEMEVSVLPMTNERLVMRRAIPPDSKAVRMLLPELSEMSACFVVAEADTNCIVGAAGATRALRRQPPHGPGVAVHVIAPYRRRGIGRTLVNQLEAIAAAHGTQALYSVKRVVRGSEAEKCWRRLGFTAHETVEVQRLPLAQFEPRLAPHLERLRPRVPASAQIVPLYRAKLPAVLELHLANMGGDRGELYRKLRSIGSAAFHPRYSKVLLVGDRVAGCILAHRKDKETAYVDADIVEPALRGGWANIWLKLEATRGALRLGIKNFEFVSFDHYADTRSFTKKMGGITVETSVLMSKSLSAEPASP